MACNQPKTPPYETQLFPDAQQNQHWHCPSSAAQPGIGNPIELSSIDRSFGLKQPAKPNPAATREMMEGRNTHFAAVPVEPQRSTKLPILRKN